MGAIAAAGSDDEGDAGLKPNREAMAVSATPAAAPDPVGDAEGQSLAYAPASNA
jgi:hypothetical protein